jgi:hypothetical protein
MQKFAGIALGVWLVAALIGLTGCGKSRAVPKDATGTKAFDSAGPEIKAEWDKIVAAHAANDYATVILTCRKLLPQSALTPEQLAALKDTMTAANAEMMDGVKKGDPAAAKALEQVNSQWR